MYNSCSAVNVVSVGGLDHYYYVDCGSMYQMRVDEMRY